MDQDIRRERSAGTLGLGLSRTRWTQGRVPNIVKASSLNPRVLVALGPLYRAVMEGASPLTRAQRKMIAIVASRVNNCFY